MKVCSILQAKTSTLLATQIVIRVENWMKEKHNIIYLFYGRYIIHMVIQEAIDSDAIKLWSWVCCCQLSCVPFNMVKEYVEAFGISLTKSYEDLYR